MWHPSGEPGMWSEAWTGGEEGVDTWAVLAGENWREGDVARS